MKLIDLTSKRFGRWTVLSRAPDRGKYTYYWNCRCDCGVERIVQAGNLRTGKSTNCGCEGRRRLGQLNFKHGAAGTPTYVVWTSIIRRCTNSNTKDYRHYGGRGILVCERWRTSFENFFADMGEKPPGLSIDRIDNDGNYEPGNCRWATMAQQNANRRYGAEVLEAR